MYLSRNFLNKKFSNHALIDSKKLNIWRASNKSGKRNSINVKKKLIKQTLSACTHISI